jgi:hypothetical protein
MACIYVPTLTMVDADFIPRETGIYLAVVKERDLKVLNKKLTVTRIREFLFGQTMWIGPTIKKNTRLQVHTYIDASSFYNERTSEIIMLRIQVCLGNRLVNKDQNRQLDFRTLVLVFNILKCIIDTNTQIVHSEQTEDSMVATRELVDELYALSRVFTVYKFWVNQVNRFHIHIVPMFNNMVYVEMVFQSREEIIEWLDLATKQLKFHF